MKTAEKMRKNHVSLCAVCSAIQFVVFIRLNFGFAPFVVISLLGLNADITRTTRADVAEYCVCMMHLHIEYRLLGLGLTKQKWSTFYCTLHTVACAQLHNVIAHEFQFREVEEEQEKSEKKHGEIEEKTIRVQT